MGRMHRGTAARAGPNDERVGRCTWIERIHADPIRADLIRVDPQDPRESSHPFVVVAGPSGCREGRYRSALNPVMNPTRTPSPVGMSCTWKGMRM